MRREQDGKTWDLTPVLDLLHSITPQQNATTYTNRGLSAISAHKQDETKTEDEQGDGGGINLGNFNSLWDYLGVDRPVKSYTPTFESRTTSGNTGPDAYTSDGAIYYPPSAKSVKWRDEEQGQELADTQPDSPPSPSLGLTKNQRKKRNRKLKKAEASRNLSHGKNLLVSSESEDDEPNTPRGKLSTPTLKTKSGKASSSPARKPAHNHTDTAASKNGLPQPQSGPSTPVPSRQQPSSATLNWLSKPAQSAAMPAPATSSSANPQPQSAKPTKNTPVTDKVAEAVDRVSAALANASKSNVPHTPNKPISNSLHQSLQKQHGTPDNVPAYLQHRSTSTPSSAPPKQTVTTTQAPKQTTDLSSFPVIQKQPSRFRHEILPLELRSTDDRNWTLLLKLLRNFPDERKHLLSPLQLSINRPQPTGIHVFVDASNILIGFQEHLKRARGIPQFAHVERVYPSFHALALLLERRRPAAKRVLAGSTPEVAAFEEARQVGYETCILDKVWKAKELTEKQRRMAARNSGGGGGGGGGGSGYVSAGDASDEYGYMSDNAAVQQATQQKPRWVEQAVDEILHLKILESIVDTSIDAQAAASERPTMVLATGDAAEAEYSSGFLKMVERALKAGWDVEVMAWGGTVSMDYRRLENSARWGARFKIVTLDEYAEELFSESA